MKKVCVFLADGFEEVEGLTAVDLLRRAGAEVKMVSVMESLKIRGAHGIDVEADILFEQAEDEGVFDNADMLVLPGGMPGTRHLKEHRGLAALLKKFDREKKYIAAICAAPGILGAIGILEGRKACSYPSLEDTLHCGEVVYEPAVADGHIITGRGVGTAIPFALLLIETLFDKKKSGETAEAIVFEQSDMRYS